MTERTRPPRALVWVAAVGALAGIVMAFAGASVLSATTDDSAHTRRLATWFETGWYAFPPELADNAARPEDKAFAYAPATALTAHGIGALLGVEEWGSPQPTEASYVVRHLVVAAMALVGLAAAAALVQILLRDWRWAVVSAGLLAALPIWTGLAMMDRKNVPVAVGYTVATLGFALIVRHSEKRAVGSSLIAAVATALGIGLAVGTRPGTWTGLFIGAVGAIALLVIARRWREAGWTAGWITAAAVAAAVPLVAVYPKLFGDPRLAFLKTARVSGEFPDYDRNSRWYVLQYAFYEIPILVLLFAVVGTVIGVGVLARLHADPIRSVQFAVVGAQAFALPLAAVVLNSPLTLGLHQLLFAIPALAVVATVGVAALWTRGRPRWAKVAVGGAAVLAIAAPVVDQVTLFPYQYSYRTLLADVAGADSTNDFLRSSYAAYSGTLPAGTPIACKFHESPRKPGVDCREYQFSVIAPRWKAEGLPIEDTSGEQWIALLLPWGGVPDNCEEFDSVERWRHGFTAVMSRAALCTPPAG